jgi:nicotinamidase-related amidase
MDPDKTALVVVDVQNGFVTDNSRHVVPVIAYVVDRWTAAGRPVIFTRYLNHPESLFHSLMSSAAERRSNLHLRFFYGWPASPGPERGRVVVLASPGTRAMSATPGERRRRSAQSGSKRT